ncbi:cyclic nucleotide-binding domain-containing protein [Halomonas sp. NO4]|uniref:cyclic nucleotide-binding domain-containing protein n=1 Tax=Halomonas sp. NO4 TaxID=2484813 RepID=UPI0013D0459F|nr:cyclic nucleotide-binding domain-containing protein [Halomonas sp. NO4]
MTSIGKPLHAARLQGADCKSCYLNSLCLPGELSDTEVVELQAIVRPLIRLAKHEVLYVQGAPFSSLYAVRSGSFKQATTAESGEYLVTGLFLPGELLGLDAMAEKRYSGTLVALETSTVCELPYQALVTLCDRLPALRHRLQRSLSREIHDERLRLCRLLRRTADRRLACFLTSVSKRFQHRGYSPYRFRVSLSRADLGSYLGLTEETVGRALKRCEEDGLLTVHGREFHLKDLPRLEHLARASGRRKA